MKISKNPSFLNLIDDYTVEPAQPRGIRHFLNFGFLLMVFLMTLLVTGITLSIHYNSSVLEVFNLARDIMINISNGWPIYHPHSSVAPVISFLLYVYVLTRSYPELYAVARLSVWTVRTVMFVLIAAMVCLGSYSIIPYFNTIMEPNVLLPYVLIIIAIFCFALTYFVFINQTLDEHYPVLHQILVCTLLLVIALCILYLFCLALNELSNYIVFVTGSAGNNNSTGHGGGGSNDAGGSSGNSGGGNNNGGGNNGGGGNSGSTHFPTSSDDTDEPIPNFDWSSMDGPFEGELTGRRVCKSLLDSHKGFVSPMVRDMDSKTKELQRMLPEHWSVGTVSLDTYNKILALNDVAQRVKRETLMRQAVITEMKVYSNPTRDPHYTTRMYEDYGDSTYLQNILGAKLRKALDIVEHP